MASGTGDAKKLKKRSYDKEGNGDEEAKGKNRKESSFKKPRNEYTLNEDAVVTLSNIEGIDGMMTPIEPDPQPIFFKKDCPESGGSSSSSLQFQSITSIIPDTGGDSSLGSREVLDQISIPKYLNVSDTRTNETLILEDCLRIEQQSKDCRADEENNGFEENPWRNKSQAGFSLHDGQKAMEVEEKSFVKKNGERGEKETIHLKIYADDSVKRATREEAMGDDWKCLDGPFSIPTKDSNDTRFSGVYSKTKTGGQEEFYLETGNEREKHEDFQSSFQSSCSFGHYQTPMFGQEWSSGSSRRPQYWPPSHQSLGEEEGVSRRHRRRLNSEREEEEEEEEGLQANAFGLLAQTYGHTQCPPTSPIARKSSAPRGCVTSGRYHDHDDADDEEEEEDILTRQGLIWDDGELDMYGLLDDIDGTAEKGKFYLDAYLDLLTSKLQELNKEE